MLRCPASSAEYFGWSQATLRWQQRTDQSAFSILYAKVWEVGRRPTKISIPLTSPFQLSVIFVLFFGQIEIHAEQGFRTIGQVGFSRLGFHQGLGSRREATLQ